MHRTTAAAGPSGPAPIDVPRSLRAVAIAAILVACVAGLLVAITAPGGRSAAAERRPDSGERMLAASSTSVERTSFGMLGVDEPTLVHGMTARSLAGMTHNINDYVAPENELVQVPFVLSNGSDDAIAYDSSQFELERVLRRRRAGKRLSPTASSSLHPGLLQRGTSIEGNVSFVVPRDGAALFLRYREPNGLLHRIPVGSAGDVYHPKPGDHVTHLARAPGEHQHHH